MLVVEEQILVVHEVGEQVRECDAARSIPAVVEEIGLAVEIRLRRNAAALPCGDLFGRG